MGPGLAAFSLAPSELAGIKPACCLSRKLFEILQKFKLFEFSYLSCLKIIILFIE